MMTSTSTKMDQNDNPAVVNNAQIVKMAKNDNLAVIN